MPPCHRRGAPLGAVYFPDRFCPMRARPRLAGDLADLRNRAGDRRLPPPADRGRRGGGRRAGLPKLYGDMAKYTVTDGMAFDAPSAVPGWTHCGRSAGRHPRAGAPGSIPPHVDGAQRVFLEAYRATAAIDRASG